MLRAQAGATACARVGLGAALVLAALPSAARGYTYASPAAAGCHEAISIAALRSVRAELQTAAPLATGGDDWLWIGELPLHLPAAARDLGTASLVVGVRDNDLKGKHGLDVSALARVHGDPDTQAEHCLRRPEHDEPSGSAAALADCRAYIRGRFAAALDGGLDARGYPDPEARRAVAVYLEFAGESRVPMPLFYVELGRALHALQDSFAHALRSDDGLRVRGLLNWVDVAAEHLDEARDGPAHRAALDRCEQLDSLQELRLRHALAASSALLRIAHDPALDAQAKLARADLLLDRYLSFEPGCGAERGFCDAPELRYPAAEPGCRGAPGRSGSPDGSPALLGWLLCAALARRRALRRVLLAPLALVVLAAPVRVAAQPAAAAAGEPPAFALSGALAAALDEPAAAAALGARYRLSERWLLGLDTEWNPWVALETGRARAGSFNAYVTLSFRVPLHTDFALRTSAQAGASLLLFDVYGAPRGSLGPYLGLSLVGLELALSRSVRLILEPASVALPIPHVAGIPLAHRQYRAGVGVELWL